MRTLPVLMLATALAPSACGAPDGGGTDAPGPGDVVIVICQGPADCDDGDGCTTDQCVGGRCQNPARSCDDDNPCTADRCEAGACLHDAAPGCCTSETEDTDCDDGNFCTKDACIDGACVNGDPILPPNCCNADGECDDGDDCTKNRCDDNHRCDFGTKDPAAGCCKELKDCLDGDSCTDDACVNERCVHARQPGCCNRDADCAGDDPCVAGTCRVAAQECEYAPVPGCCREDADCPDVPCSAATCTGNACVRTPIEGCCTGDGDCGDPCRECDIPAGGDRGTCVLKGTPECCTTSVLETAFTDLGGFVASPLPGAGYASTPSWTLDGLRTTSGPTALYFGDPATHRIHPAGEGLVGGRATRAGLALDATTKPVLTFQAYRSGSIVSSVDVLSVIVADGGAEAVAWTSLDHPIPDDGAFHPVSVDLSAFEGRVVSLVLEFDSRSAFATDHEGVWVDDLKVSGQCR